MDKITEIFRKNLVQKRKAAKLSQETLAERASLAATHLSQIENGHRWPKPETVTNLAHALGVSEAELFSNDQQPAASPTVEALTKIIEDQERRIQELESKPTPPADSNVIEIEVDDDYSDAYIKTVETILSMLALLKEDDVAEVLEDLRIRFPWAITDERTFTLRKRG